MRVLLFAHLKDVVGCGEFELRLTETLSAEGLWSMLVERHPDLAAFRSSVRLARNQTYAGPGEQFEDQDEVALIPPVSGG